MCGSRRGKEEKEGKEPGAVGWLRTRRAQVDLPDPHCPLLCMPAE